MAVHVDGDETLQEIKWDLYSKYSKQMCEFYGQMVDFVNQTVIYELAKIIALRAPENHGKMVMPDGIKEINCWLLYDNFTWNHDANYWVLLLADGRLAGSRNKRLDNIWTCSEALGFHRMDDDTGHHDIILFVQAFDGLLAVGKEVGFTEGLLLKWKSTFYGMYAEYMRLKELRLIQTGEK